MKVLLAGMSKTGTKSMAVALRELGYDVYDYLENYMYLGKDWEKIFRDGGSTDDFRRMYENVDAVVDVPAFAYWDEILKAFPDTKIILTMRENEDVWIRSQMNQMRAATTPIIRLMTFLSPTYRRMDAYGKRMIVAVYGWMPPGMPLFGEPRMNELQMRLTYRRHNAHVLMNAPTDKLLVYSIKDGWDPLCKFLDKPVPKKPFPHKNIRGNIVEDLLKTNPVFIRMQREALLSCSIILAAFCFGGYKLARGSNPISWLKNAGNIAKSFLTKLPL